MSHSSIAQTLAPIHAALSALATLPGRLYSVAYLGPLEGPAPLRQALGETRRLRDVRVAEINSAEGRTDADVLICSLGRAGEVRAALHHRRSVQLLVFGDKAPEQLSEAECASLGSDAILVDVRPDLAILPGARIAEAVEEAVYSAGQEPLVLLAGENAVQEMLEECELHLASAGLRVRVLDGARDLAVRPQPGEAWVIALRENSGPSAATAAAAAAGCRAAGVPLLIVTVTKAWDDARGDATWRAAVARCSVIRGGAGATTDARTWPSVAEMWIGGLHPPPDVEPALRIPAGTPLVAALAHLEIGGRPGSLVVWGSDRVAVIRADQRAPGAVVVDVRLGTVERGGTREEALQALDAVRGWVDVKMAVVCHPHRGPGCLEETVTRLGFFLSRTDDERSAGVVGPSIAVPRCTRGDVACVLVQHGLTGEAVDVLRDHDGEPGRSIEDALLLAWLIADRSPAEAVMELREVAFRAASERTPAGEALQVQATLNALLLLVRARQIAPEDAWESVERWISDAGIGWVTTPQHAGIVFELATRSGHVAEARILAARLGQLGAGSRPLLSALRPHIQAVLSERRAA